MTKQQSDFWELLVLGDPPVPLVSPVELVPPVGKEPDDDPPAHATPHAATIPRATRAERVRTISET